MKNSPSRVNGVGRDGNSVLVLWGLLEEPPVFLYLRCLDRSCSENRSPKYYSVRDIFSPIVSFFVLLHQSRLFLSYPDLTTLVISTIGCLRDLK